MELHPVHKIFSDNPNSDACVIDVLQKFLHMNVDVFSIEDWLHAYEELEPMIPKIQNRNEFILHDVCFSDFVKWSLWDSTAIICATTPCSEYVCRCFDKLRDIANRKLGTIRETHTKDELIDILSHNEFV